MPADLDTIRTIATIATPLTTAIVDTWLRPKLTNLSKYLHRDKVVFENSISTKFDEYLQRSFERNSFINVVVFQNQQKRLDELYIPLKVVNREDDGEILVDSYKQELIPSYRKVLIEDTAGMGKSTILKFLFLSCVSQNQGIPIFIELRKIGGEDSLLTYIHNELNAIDEEFDNELMLGLIKQGDFIFFLDGYDEIPFGIRDDVSRKLQEFISKCGKNLYIMASRSESSLASFSDFKRFNIKPLLKEEAFQLLRRYDTVGDLSEEIISKLKGGQLKAIDEFLGNPFLTSLLYKSYEYKQTIPFKKHIFYRQVYDALFESHDLSKGGAFFRQKHSQLDVEDFHRVLRAFGFISAKLGQVEYDKDTLISLLTTAKDYCPNVSFKESNFVRDLLTTVPIFNRDGNYYRWSHKSFQEYFAAQFIWLDTKGKQERIIQQMVRSENSENYRNILDLYYDMDYKTFRDAIIYPYVKDFLDHYESVYQDFDGVDNTRLHERKLLTFSRVFCLVSPALWKGHSNKSDGISLQLLKAELTKLESTLDGFRLWQLDEGDVILSFFNHNHFVTQLLNSKEKALFVEGGELAFVEELKKCITDDYPEDYHELRDKLLANLPVDVMLLSDDPTLKINREPVFGELNVFLYGESSSYGFPDPIACRKFVAEFENEARDYPSDELLKGL